MSVGRGSINHAQSRHDRIRIVGVLVGYRQTANAPWRRVPRIEVVPSLGPLGRCVLSICHVSLLASDGQF